MKRTQVDTATRVTDRAVTEKGKSIVFNYEKYPDKKTTSCAFSVFPNTEDATQELSGNVGLDQNHATVYFNTPPKHGQLSLLADIIREVEKIFELDKEPKPESAPAPTDSTDATGNSK